MTLGQRIQEHRLRLELSQEALGERLGVSRQAVSKWEADAAVPDTDKLIALSKLFGLTLNELLQVEGPEAGQAAENAEETPRSELREEEKPGKKKMHAASCLLPGLAVLALVLGLTAMTVSFGRMAGQLSDRITRLELRVNQLETASTLDPADLVARWEIRPGQGDTVVEAYDEMPSLDVPVEVMLTQNREEEPMEVEFVFSDEGIEPIRAEGQAAPGVPNLYSAVLTIPLDHCISGTGTLSVVFRQGGAEYLQPLAESLGIFSDTVDYDPVLERE